MRRLIFSLVVVLGSAAAIAAGATGAFFSDTETSTGNTFAAGAIDLKVDNDSYYNGNRCTDVDQSPNDDVHDFQWVGPNAFPIPGTACDTSFPLSDLDDGFLFFNFTDLKPDDEGEDTISLHVQNDAYACMDVTLTSNDDRSSVDPELDDEDAQEDQDNTWDGELAQNLQFFWWADDGDNVYEEGENSISNGVQSLLDLAPQNGVFSVALADSQNNVWDPNNPGPLPANQTKYIGKAWCFGTLTLDPVLNNGGVNPSVDPGVDCDGTALDNITQTDSATLDVAFRAIQARHNSGFQCGGGGEQPRLAKINVIKQIINDNGGNNVTSDFQLFIDNGTTATNLTSGATTTVAADTYIVDESGGSGYTRSFSGDCDSNGNITLNPGDEKYCIITNNDLEAHITLVKDVTNDNGGTATANSAWGFTVNGVGVSNNTSLATTSNTQLFINEAGRAGYRFVSISGAGCPAATSTPIVLNEGESITCTIHNDDNAPQEVTVTNGTFGDGATSTDPTGWEEQGNDANNNTFAIPATSGNNSASPDGGRFALIGDNEWICQAVNTTGLTNLQLKYYWRGDPDAEDGDSGFVEYRTTGNNCEEASGWTATVHELDDANNNVDEGWSALQTLNMSNGVMFIRFRNGNQDAANENFRVDGITLTGTPI